MKSKEELIKQVTELEERNTDLRNKLYDRDKFIDNLENNLDKKENTIRENSKYIKKLENQIHFLCWILYKEKVNLVDYWPNGIQVQIINSSDFSNNSQCNYE